MAGQFRHIDFTLSGASQNIGASLTDAQLIILLGSAAALAQARTKYPGFTTEQLADLYQCKGFSLQGAPAGGNAIYIGGKGQTVSGSSYGWVIPAASGGVAAPPLFYPGYGGAVIRLTDLVVFGTNNDVLHIMLHEW